MLGSWRVAGLALILVTSLLLTACSASPDPADASAPLLVHGVVHDYAEQPVPSAHVTVSITGPAEDHETGEYGDVGGPLVLQMDVTADADGRFAIHLAPSDKIAEAFTETDGQVGFTLTARVPDPDQSSGSWTFTRTIMGASWSGGAPGVVLRPVNSGTEGCC
jgi:hypothetical protein